MGAVRESRASASADLGGTMANQPGKTFGDDNGRRG